MKRRVRSGIEPDANFLVDMIFHDLRHEATTRLSFDNDDERNDFAGDRMIKRIRDGFPQFSSKLEDHKPPTEFKDWNDVLTGKRKPETA